VGAGHPVQVCRLIGKKIRPHTFRHSFAINIVRHGIDIRRLRQVLGHSNIHTTAIYLQFQDKDRQEVYANVQFWLNGIRSTTDINSLDYTRFWAAAKEEEDCIKR
jgi:hypothetical protein